MTAAPPDPDADDTPLPVPAWWQRVLERKEMPPWLYVPLLDDDPAPRCQTLKLPLSAMMFANVGVVLSCVITVVSALAISVNTAFHTAD